MKLFFSVGEPSGDLHGANLIRALKAHHTDVRCVGYGGPKMRSAGCQLHADLTEYAVMFFKQVFANLQRFRQLLREARRYFEHERPDAVILIDYPGFNWWIARAAKACGIPVFYYGTPQMWAWGSWRVGKMRRLVDHALCKLPFEADWFNARGCSASYVGHPYFDELAEQKFDEGFLKSFANRDRRVLTLLPGSRTQEVLSNLPWFFKAAKIVHDQLPGTRVVVASFNEKQADMARKMAEMMQADVEIYSGRTPELIQAADCCLACSGSVSLELLYHQKPTAILYYVSRFQYALVRYFLIQVKFITLVNLLAEDDPFASLEPVDFDSPQGKKVPFPEYPTYQDESERLAKHALEWLTNDAERERKVAQLADLRSRYAKQGASVEAAREILRRLTRKDTEGTDGGQKWYARAA